MPNYRYYPSRQASCQTDSVHRQSSNMRTGSCSGTQGAVTCCNDNSKYDEHSGMPLAMAYVPWQKWRSIYEADKGFRRGTIFEQLDKPFLGAGGNIR